MVQLKAFFQATIHSYGQVLFTQSKWACLLLLIASFLDFSTGVAGLLGAIAVNSLAHFANFSNEDIKQGLYGFNGLLMGLGLGAHMHLNITLVLWIVIGAVFILLLTNLFKGILTKYGLPFLSFPFLIVWWAFLLSLNKFSFLIPNENSIYTANTIKSLLGNTGYEYYDLTAQSLNKHVLGFFQTLGSLFFQYNLLSGVLISIALWISSRINFMLAIVGYIFGYILFKNLFPDEPYIWSAFIGFNFILTLIALGGFFIVPSTKSIIYGLFALTIVAFFSVFLNGFLTPLGLVIYSLPFVVTVWLVLYLYNSTYIKDISLVKNQIYSPELHRLDWLHSIERYKSIKSLSIHLPFWGEWYIAQGYDGNITHKDNWKEALDFVITDAENNTFKFPGNQLDDYYCYNKTVLAPADGVVVNLVDGVGDNAIGATDMHKNWGNTIVISHGNGSLYSQISHIRPGTFSVKVGDFVRTGQVIALCGSSGRSPEPHLHFQLQLAPHIGSSTFSFPIANYLGRLKDEKLQYFKSDIPKEGMLVTPIQNNSLLEKIMRWEIGQKLIYTPDGNADKQRFEWIVAIDAVGAKYLWCAATKAIAYFVQDKSVVYFTQYYGSKKSPLFGFYLTFYRVILGFYKDLAIQDLANRALLPTQPLHWPIDLISPFVKLKQLDFELKLHSIDAELNTKKIEGISTLKMGNKSFLNASFTINANAIQMNTSFMNKLKFNGICEIA